MTDDSLTQARRLLAAGFSVIPVPRPDAARGHDGKVPVIAWRAYQERLPTEAELVAWFSTPHNFAIVTGAISGVVAIDADSRDALRWCVRRLPYTPLQVETPRGCHLYYRHPGVRVPNRARIETRDGRLAIDVRGDGGYVIAAGSLHATGAKYVEAGDWTAPREEVPRFWPGWLARSNRPKAPPAAVAPFRPVGDVVERARRYLAAIPRPEIGNGSDAATLSAACRLVRGFDLPATDAEALLVEWAAGRAGWTREWIAEKVAHAIRYGTEPIGALR